MSGVFKGEHPVLFALLMSLSFILATFVRPVTYYLVLPLALGLLIYCRWRLRRPWPAVFAILGALLLPWLLLIGGWQARNYCRADSAEFSSIQGASLLLYRAAGIVALRDGIPLEQAREQLLKALPDMTGWPTARRYEVYRREGLALIRRYPILCLKTQITGLVSMLAGPGGSALADYFNLHGRAGAGSASSSSATGRAQSLLKPLRLAVSGYQFLFLALLYAGLLLYPWFLRKHKALWAPALFIGLVSAYLIAVSAGPEAYSRFRLPLIPAFALFSGAGFVAAWQHWRRGAHR